MLLPVFQDLIKPQWRKVLETLKQDGGLSISELSRRTGTSYMGAKSHCEELTKLGYLVRTRIPRTEVGRPEILYNLTPKANDLFPQAGMAFTLELLDEVKRMFGESAPEKLIFQHFQHQQEAWKKSLDLLLETDKKVAKLVKLRHAAGCIGQPNQSEDQAPGWTEIHHPLFPVFTHYPRVATMELRMIEDLLGCRVQRHEAVTGRDSAPRVVFELEG